MIADPGFCSTLFGTRADILVPSACLNSTVCGLVSRTVLNELIRPGMFHGAKVYRELPGADRSAQFLDAVSGHFPRVAARWLSAGRRRRRRPLGTCAGWQRGQRVQSEFGLASQTWSSPGSARRPGCCCAGCLGTCCSGPTAANMWTPPAVAKQRGVQVGTTAACRTAASGWSGRRPGTRRPENARSRPDHDRPGSHADLQLAGNTPARRRAAGGAGRESGRTERRRIEPRGQDALAALPAARVDVRRRPAAASAGSPG